MESVTELGYVGISVSDANAWKKYATEIMGLEVLDEGEDDRYYLRMDYWHHRIVVHVDGNDDLEYIGWRVADRLALEAMERQIRNCGIKVRIASKEECQERRVLGLLKLEDPAGNPTEIFYGPQVDTDRPFHPGRPMHGGFVTGADGLGHVLIRQPDVEAGFQFYTKVLGMQGSIEYNIPTPNGGTASPVFFHCNQRQHSLAFGLGEMDKRINHLTVETANIDDVGRAYDLIKKRHIPLAMSLGKHSNDQALSFYMGNPSGWLIEYSWGPRKAPAQAEYYVTDIWGHATSLPGHGLNLDINRD